MPNSKCQVRLTRHDDEPSSAFGIWHSASGIRRAFTLIELLIVLAIIGAVVALGIPLFGVLTGAKSVEAGRNVVAATLGQARTVAVNEGKYAGVLFFVDPATERTAMSIVIVTDPASSLEDPDPYDKYKAWDSDDQEYYSGKVDGLGQKVPNRGDRVIGLAADGNATYRGELYDPKTPDPPLVSNYLKLLGNYRPTVKVYRCITSHKSDNPIGIRPPQNGPFFAKTDKGARFYDRPTGAATGAPYDKTLESLASRGGFANNNWAVDDVTELARYSTGEQTLLPRGVGVQLLVQPIQVPAVVPASGMLERYVRTGVIMFDPQGRLVLRNFKLDATDTLGAYMLLNANAKNIVSGVGLTLYDATALQGKKSSTSAPSANEFASTESDVVYESFGYYPISAPNNPAFNDSAGANESERRTHEIAEESWLDANGTPLIINRYTGSMSEAQ